MRLAIDLMGGDSSPQELFQGVLQSARELSNVQTFFVIATREIIQQLPNDHPHLVQFQVADEVITMEDAPLQAVKSKKGSTLHKGLELIKKKKADAFITAGNTGALIAATVLNLPRLSTIDRPALLAVLPTVKKPVVVIDVGGTVSCRPKNLLQFALMGACYQRCIFDNARPKIGLLNIGIESKKGPLELQETYELLKSIAPESGFTFLGNIEGRDVFKGDVDVLVTDGFTGNVFLKASEGASAFALQTCQSMLKEAGHEMPQSLLEALQKQFYNEENPGAFVSGVDGIVVKCHGSSSSKAFYHSIQGAATLVEKNIVSFLG